MKPKVQQNLSHWVAFFIIVAAIILRKPILLLEARFWAEEGSVFFTHAMNAPWYDVVLAPHQGYFSLFNNVVALLAAHAVSLPNAPFVTTYAAFVVQCLPYVVILFGCSRYWSSLNQKILASLIVLFVGQDSEIWLNSINSQFHFSVLVFLILCEDLAAISLRRFKFYCGLLFVAALTGVVSCFLTPFFCYRAWLVKDKRYYIVAALMSLLTLIQLAIVVFAPAPENMGSRFMYGLPIGNVVAGWFSYTFVSAVFNPLIAETVMKTLEAHFWNMPSMLVIMILIVVILVLCSRRLSEHIRIIFCLSIVVIAVLSIMGAVFGGARPRYAYNTAVIFMLLLLQQIRIGSAGLMSMVASILLASGLLFNSYQFFFQYENYNSQWPRWQEQVQAYENGEINRLRVHPSDLYFSVRLPPK